ncbi:MAG: methylmalonyl Co-A mutase-associated GTPase MeaB [Bacteroidales bacterium]|nr:methylmalonyl Co-A mutase-associated GTPase MeaB [Bacteroidales bacterium]
MDKNNKYQSALKVQTAIPQPPSVNPNISKRFLLTNDILDLDTYVDGILSGNRVVLSKAITLIESHLPSHRETAQKIIECCLSHTGNSIRIGITGVPGAGKSTFIESFGTFLTAKNKNVAVLAIDPSSQRTKGSILGDKTRMEDLANDAKAFIRPSPSAGSLGGVAQKTRESMMLCEAAGFDVVIVETVGVGQSETAVHAMVDFFLLLMIAGAGDELQGIKRGIMEMADALMINKADGENLKRAQQAQAEYRSALHIFPKPESGWTPQVGIMSALEKTGIEETWNMILNYVAETTKNGYFHHRRNMQNQAILTETIKDNLLSNFFNNKTVKEKLKCYETQIQEGKINPYTAAYRLLKNTDDTDDTNFHR